MKRRFIKFLGIALALVITMGAFGGCNLGIQKDPNQEKVDETRTQIRIAAPDDGFGMEGYYALKDLFEEEYKDVSFEEGKKGVQVLVDGDKMSYAGSTLIGLLDSTENEIFFTNMIAYHTHYGKFLEITDLINEDMADVGESGKTIKSKMNDTQIEYFDRDGKTYALPHNASFQSLNYNVDLFDKNLLYFSDNLNNGNEGFIRTPVEKKGTGPDGKYNTSDDGLPRTYDEFFVLCARMKRMGISPWTMVAGKYPAYVGWLVAALWADYEGAEQANLRWNMNGTAYNIIDTINNDGTFTLKGNGNGYAITKENAYELYAQAGGYYALKFLDGIIHGDNGKGYYAKNTFNQSASHTGIQADFVYTDIVPGAEKIGMLGEGCWWYAESKSVFDSLASTYPGADRTSRRFRVMPLPKATEEKVGEKSTTICALENVAFIKKNIAPAKKELAELFFKWCHTDRALRAFTVASGTVKDFKYSFGEEEFKALPLWVQSAFEYIQNSEIAYAAAENPVYLSYPADFYPEDLWRAKVGGDTHLQPSQAMKDYGVRAIDYFKGIKNYYNSSYWSKYL